jgi:hypothetical protein
LQYRREEDPQELRLQKRPSRLRLSDRQKTFFFVKMLLQYLDRTDNHLMRYKQKRSLRNVFNATAWATRTIPTFKTLFKFNYQRLLDIQRIRVFSYAVTRDIASVHFAS